MLFQSKKLFQTVAKGLKTFWNSKNLSLLILILSYLGGANLGQAMAQDTTSTYQRKAAGGLYSRAPQNTTAQFNQAQQQQDIFQQNTASQLNQAEIVQNEVNQSEVNPGDITLLCCINQELDKGWAEEVETQAVF